MRYYETLFLINPNLADEEYKDMVIKFNDITEKRKGVVINIEEWGKKTLAYAVKKFDKGYYVLLQYCGEPGIVAEIERGLQLDERVLKYQTVKLNDEVDPEELKAGKKESEKMTGPSQALERENLEEDTQFEQDQEANDEW